MVQERKQALDPAIIEGIDKHLTAAFELAQQGNYAEGEKHIKEAWALMPEPKYQWNFSNITMLSIARFYRDKGDFNEAKQWAQTVFDRGNVRSYDAEPDFVLGTIYYEAGDNDRAREHLQRAFHISKGASFQTEDIKYLKFLKSRKK